MTQTNHKTQVYNLVILDKSGSMNFIAKAAISGFNETVAGIREAQEKFKETQEHFVSLLVFCSCERRLIYDKVPVNEIVELTAKEYRPCCGTPLYDAMGFSLNELLKDIKDKEDATAVVTVITDGMGNASHEYSGQAIKALIENLKENEGWTFIGDIVGSVYEFNNIKTTEFPFFTEKTTFTDDSILSVAVADWLLNDPDRTHKELEKILVKYVYAFPHPMGAYGSGFLNWAYSVGDEKGRVRLGRKPYNSCGNGSAMRVSAVGWLFDTLEETERVAKISAEITHNHPEGIKGAQATAAAIFLARTGKSKQEIKAYLENQYGYQLQQTCDEIRPDYKWGATCQDTVPQALAAFFDSTDFESAIRLAVSLGGDSDTLACITGGIAEAFYGIPKDMALRALLMLPEDFQLILEKIKNNFSVH